MVSKGCTETIHGDIVCHTIHLSTHSHSGMTTRASLVPWRTTATRMKAPEMWMTLTNTLLSQSSQAHKNAWHYPFIQYSGLGKHQSVRLQRLQATLGGSSWRASDGYCNGVASSTSMANVTAEYACTFLYQLSLPQPDPYLQRIQWGTWVLGDGVA
jgi:hypothetical protein